MTDDVMSDCVGGDYIIMKNWKKWLKLWTRFKKRDESRNFPNRLKWIFWVSFVPILNILSSSHPFWNLEGLKVGNRRKKKTFFGKFAAITFYWVRIFSKSLGSAQKAVWRYYWDFWWWSKTHPLFEIESTVLKISAPVWIETFLGWKWKWTAFVWRLLNWLI